MIFYFEDTEKRMRTAIPLGSIVSVNLFQSHMPPGGIAFARKGGTVIRFSLALNGALSVMESTFSDPDAASQVYESLLEELKTFHSKGTASSPAPGHDHADHVEEEVLDLIQGFKRRAEACDKNLTEVPVDDSDINVRSHVRLRAKAATYRHCEELLRGLASRLSIDTEEIEVAPDMVELIRWESSASDWTGDELVFRVFSGLVEDEQPEIPPEYAAAYSRLKTLDEDTQYKLVKTALKQIDHY